MLYDYPSLYWRLDDPAGSATFADQSGTGYAGTNPATDAGTAASRYQVPGAPVGDGDTAAYFDGAGSNVICDVNDTSGTADYSIEVWFKTSSSTGGLIAANVADPVGNPSGWTRMMYVDSGNQLTYGDWTGGPIQAVRSSSTVNDGQWHHAVGWHSGTSLSLYLDGALQGTVSSPQQVYGNRWILGGASVSWTYSAWPNKSASTYFTGSIDEFAFYTHPLSGTQVAAHRNAISNGTGYANAVKADSPALYWRLDDNPLSVSTTDSSGSGITGAYYLTNRIVGNQPGALTTVPDQATWFSGRGTNAYAQTSMTSPNPFTFTLWFKTTTHRGGVLAGFNSSPTSYGGSRDRHLWMLDNGTLALGVWTGAASVIYSPASYNDGQWHYAAASVGAAGLKLHVDGALVAVNAGTTSAITYSGYWWLGANDLDTWPSPSTSYYFAGWLDEFSVVGTQLPDARIAQLYAVR